MPDVADRSFKLCGHVFVVRWFVVRQTWSRFFAEWPEREWADRFKLVDEAIMATLEPESAQLWREVRSEIHGAVELQDIAGVLAYVAKIAGAKLPPGFTWDSEPSQAVAASPLVAAFLERRDRAALGHIGRVFVDTFERAGLHRRMVRSGSRGRGVTMVRPHRRRGTRPRATRARRTRSVARGSPGRCSSGGDAEPHHHVLVAHGRRT